jgi:organic radical activating enzyme
LICLIQPNFYAKITLAKFLLLWFKVRTVSIVYPIAETFHSVQGEGYWAGTNAFFIRLGWCDVHCPWCDQKETWPQKGYPEITATALADQAYQVNPGVVIITGGEPLLHNLEPLTTALRDRGLTINLETSGAHPLSGIFDWVTLSPKPFKLPDPSIYPQAKELKVIVQQQEDLTFAEEQGQRVNPETIKYLQPEWNNFDQAQGLIFDYVLDHPDWRISLQTHKWIGVQ